MSTRNKDTNIDGLVLSSIGCVKWGQHFFSALLNMERPRGILPTGLINIASVEFFSHWEYIFTSLKKIKWKLKFLKQKVVFTSLYSDKQTAQLSTRSKLEFTEICQESSSKIHY